MDLGSLRKSGWLRTRLKSLSDFDAEIRSIGLQLGKPIKGRRGVIESLQPLSQTEAPTKSLSAKFGEGDFPPHVELAHRHTPCRYVILACEQSGSSGSSTILIDWRKIELSAEDRALLSSAPLLVRSGRASFYSTILSQRRPYIRYDPGCMEAFNLRGAEALKVFEREIAKQDPIEFCWTRGDVLVIDNWRMLHGRRGSTASKDRRLIRMMIGDN